VLLASSWLLIRLPLGMAYGSLLGCQCSLASELAALWAPCNITGAQRPQRPEGTGVRGGAPAI